MIAREQMLPMLRSLTLAVGVHGLMALLVVLGTINWEPFRKPKPVGLTIEAVIVDTSKIRERREQAQREADEAVRRRDAEERRDQEMEQQRQREVEQQQKREADQEALRKREAQDRLSQLRLERERKKEAEREKQDKALEQIREQAKEAEKQRQIDEQQLKQLEQRKQEEADKQRQQLEAIERQKAVDAEARQFRAGRQAELADDYEAAVQAVVTQNWLRPPTAQPGLRCTLKIVQIPGGSVISTAIAGPCNGDEATRRSVEAAVQRAGALPYRGFEDVFQREIEFNFIYDGD
jgi:colicin import membrane protein